MLASLPPLGELGCCRENPYPRTYSQVGPQAYNIHQEAGVCAYGLGNASCNLFPCEMDGTSKGITQKGPKGITQKGPKGARFTQKDSSEGITHYMNPQTLEHTALWAKKGETN